MSWNFQARVSTTSFRRGFEPDTALPSLTTPRQARSGPPSTTCSSILKTATSATVTSLNSPTKIPAWTSTFTKSTSTTRQAPTTTLDPIRVSVTHLDQTKGAAAQPEPRRTRPFFRRQAVAKRPQFRKVAAVWPTSHRCSSRKWRRRLRHPRSTFWFPHRQRDLLLCDVQEQNASKLSTKMSCESSLPKTWSMEKFFPRVIRFWKRTAMFRRLLQRRGPSTFLLVRLQLITSKTTLSTKAAFILWHVWTRYGSFKKNKLQDQCKDKLKMCKNMDGQESFLYNLVLQLCKSFFMSFLYCNKPFNFGWVGRYAWSEYFCTIFLLFHHILLQFSHFVSLETWNFAYIGKIFFVSNIDRLPMLKVRQQNSKQLHSHFRISTNTKTTHKVPLRVIT